MADTTSGASFLKAAHEGLGKGEIRAELGGAAATVVRAGQVLKVRPAAHQDRHFLVLRKAPVGTPSRPSLKPTG